jgi:hypothetical protein
MGDRHLADATPVAAALLWAVTLLAIFAPLAAVL